MPISYDNLAGSVTTQGTTEPNTVYSSSTGTVAHNYQTAGNVGVFTSPSGNVTLNITNLPTTNNRTFVFSMIVEQGATPYIISALQIDGSAQTINWANAITPSGTASKKEIFTFVIYRAPSTWYTLGSMTSYG